MIKFIAISVLALAFTTGCFNRPNQYRDVPVPVYQVPAPPSIERPHLPIHDLTASDRDNLDRIVRAYVVSVKLLLVYSVALDQVVETYRELARRTDSFWTDPRFAMSLTDIRAEPLEITELERLRMIAQGRQISSDTELMFSEILQNYKDSKAEIWRDYETSTD